MIKTKKLNRQTKKVSLKNIIVEVYRAVSSLNDSFQSSDFLLLLLLLFLLISVNGKTYKSAIKRPIKIRTHHVVRKHTHKLTNGRQAVQEDRQLDERTDGQI